MSAWTIGAERVPAAKLGDKSAATEIIGKLARWIPGDILVLFAGAVNWVSTEPSHPSVPLLVVFWAATPCVVILSAWAKHDLKKIDSVKAFLATIAFGIWSLSIPRSGWQNWDLVSKNPGWVTGISALGGLMFGLLASGIERKFAGEFD